MLWLWSCSRSSPPFLLRRTGTKPGVGNLSSRKAPPPLGEALDMRDGHPAEDVTETRPYMTKVIHGATLTKYGKKSPPPGRARVNTDPRPAVMYI